MPRGEAELSEENANPRLESLKDSAGVCILRYLSFYC